MDHFYFSMSSKVALSILVKAVSSRALVPLVLHMDAMYKLNLNEFPVLILGLSVAQQQFHLLSISVLSHHTEAVYCEVLRVFKRVIMHVVPDLSFSPQYVVTDCDAAERYSDVWYISRYVYRIEFCNWFHNYFSSSICFLFITCRDAVTRSFPGVTHLMCYFHVVKNCKEKLHSYAKDVQQDILHDVQQVHSSVSAQECNALMTRVIPKWTELVPDFLTYFLNQWMVSDSFGSWKVYCSAPGKDVL
jgi:hypothetical protein